MISAKELLAHVGHTAQSRTALIDPFPHWLLFDSLPSKKRYDFDSYEIRLKPNENRCSKSLRLA